MIKSALPTPAPHQKKTKKTVRQVYIRGSSSSLDSQLFKRHLYRSCRPPLRYLERAQVTNWGFLKSGFSNLYFFVLSNWSIIVQFTTQVRRTYLMPTY